MIKESGTGSEDDIQVLSSGCRVNVNRISDPLLDRKEGHRTSGIAEGTDCRIIFVACLSLDAQNKLSQKLRHYHFKRIYYIDVFQSSCSINKYYRKKVVKFNSLLSSFRWAAAFD